MEFLRVLLTTFGSLGDVHPYMAIGAELLRRGHRVTLATSSAYRAKVESEGLEFHPLRPEISLDDRAMLASVMDAKRGSERVVRFVASTVRQTYEDSLEAVKRADLVITHPISTGALIAADKLGVPYVSSVLAPLSLFSAYDPPVPAPSPWLVKLKVLGPGAFRPLIALARFRTAAWVRPIYELRKDVGLPPGGHPLFEGQHSPRLVLALFSRCLAEPQPDWPPHTLVTGFPFFDRHHEHTGMPLDLERFLSSGPAPLVFSLGSSAVVAAGDFYTESLKASQDLNMRAVFLTGRYSQGLPPDVMAAPYAPHSELFPRAAAIIHHGGVGTTGQAMRSGRPMLIVPFSHDQFDNGARVKRLGMGEVLYRSRYQARSAAPLLQQLVKDPRYAESGTRVASVVQSEDGVNTAVDAILRVAN